jgi:hypothetical protein
LTRLLALDILAGSPMKFRREKRSRLFMMRIFIGYDPREAVAFHVLSHSIHARCSEPTSITPLVLSQLGGLMWRDRNPLQSTDFSFSRFLVPYLCDYQGWALFMDCDMLVLEDIAKLWALRDDAFAIMCVKHDHVPKEKVYFANYRNCGYAKVWLNERDAILYANQPENIG